MEALHLKSGRGNCVNHAQQDMLEQTMAILASMIQQAMQDAAVYCCEAERTVVMPQDIQLALKRLVLPGSAYWKREDLCEEAKQIRQEMFHSEPCAEAGSGTDSDDSWVIEAGDAEWTEATTSPLAQEMNEAPRRFEAWEPNTPFMQAVKQAVKNAYI
tara:strand:+ start:50 stop:523 length:474 start_codon:yes stop_codon:yes gene_type:complete